MSKFGFLILLLLIVCCGSPEKGNFGQEMQLTFSVDTVLVDPAEEILFLNGWLYQSFLSPDRSYLYNFNALDYSLEKIDLNQLRLMEKFFFEKEGPNGIGDRISTVFQVNSDSLYFGGYNGIGGIYTWDGKKVMDLPLNKWGDSTAHLYFLSRLVSKPYF